MKAKDFITYYMGLVDRIEDLIKDDKVLDVMADRRGVAEIIAVELAIECAEIGPKRWPIGQVQHDLSADRITDLEVGDYIAVTGRGESHPSYHIVAAKDGNKLTLLDIVEPSEIAVYEMDTEALAGWTVDLVGGWEDEATED